MFRELSVPQRGGGLRVLLRPPAEVVPPRRQLELPQVQRGRPRRAQRRPDLREMLRAQAIQEMQVKLTKFNS